MRYLLLLILAAMPLYGAGWESFNIVFECDSLTARNAANTMGTPNVATKISERHPTATVNNVSTDGHRTDQIEATGVSQVDALLHGTKTNILVCLMGANDWNQSITAAAAYENFEDFWEARVSAG